MRRGTIALLAGCAAACLAACAADPTRIVVVVDTDLPSPDELDAIEIEVDARSIGDAVEVRRASLDGATLTPPIVVAVVHDGGELGPIEVRARGLRRGTVIVERAADLSFASGRSVVLRLDLVRACVSRACDRDESCAAGSCVPRAVDSSALPEWAGREAIDGLDGGVGDAQIAADAWTPPSDAWIDPGDAADDAATCREGCECEQACVEDEGCECKSGCGCTLSCVPGDDCTHVLCDGAGTTCAIDGSGTSNLEARCDHDSTCTIDATDASNALELSCRDRSRCDVDCRGTSNCRLSCESGSQCLLRCSAGSSCDLACSAGERRWCGDGLFACNRECP